MSQDRYDESHNDDGSAQSSKSDRSSLIVPPLSKFLYSPDGSPRISRTSPVRSASHHSWSTPEFLSDSSPFTSVKPSPFENRILALAAANWKPPDNDVSPVVRTGQLNVSQATFGNGSGPPSSSKTTTPEKFPATKRHAKDLNNLLPSESSPTDPSLLSTAKSVPMRGNRSFEAATVSFLDNAKETLQGSVVPPADSESAQDSPDITPARLCIDTDSPLTPLPADYDDSNKALKRTRADSESPAFSADRRRRNRTRKENLSNGDFQPSPTEDANTNHTTSASSLGNRTFPPRVHIHHGFPMFYRCYPASSYFQREDDQFVCLSYTLNYHHRCSYYCQTSH
jgi:hypothetical protein